MTAIICLLVALILLMVFAIKLLMFMLVIGICVGAMILALWFISFWFQFLVFLTWPYGFIVLIGVALLIWLIEKLRK